MTIVPKSLPIVPGIYVIINTCNGKVYVGSSYCPQHRARQHLSDLNLETHRSLRLLNSWRKHGPDAFEMICIEELPGSDLNEILTREQFWMDFLLAYNPDYGYNINPKAGSHRGRKASPETLKKIGKSSKERWQNPSYRAKMTAYAISQQQWKSCPCLCVETGKIYSSIREAARCLGLDSSVIVKVINGKSRKTKGLTFRAIKNGILTEPIQKRKRDHCYKVLCVSNGQIYESMIIASQSTGVSTSMISEVISGKRQSAKGFIFKKLS